MMHLHWLFSLTCLNFYIFRISARIEKMPGLLPIRTRRESPYSQGLRQDAVEEGTRYVDLSSWFSLK